MTYATGGTVTTITISDVEYRVHTFTGTGTLDVTSPGEVDFLVIAGGGGGGGMSTGNAWNLAAAGGGAGGLRSSISPTGGGASAESKLSLSTGEITITVGGGGSSASGSNSSIGDLKVSVGGGVAAQSGGSGGGGFHANSAGAGNSGQGYDGGSGHGGEPMFASDRLGGGGGGAGGKGQDGIHSTVTSTPRAGGVGVSNSISGSSVTYAKGGDSGYNTADHNGANATLYGGGGQGAGINQGGSRTGGSGKAGIVIIRYVLLTGEISDLPLAQLEVTKYNIDTERTKLSISGTVKLNGVAVNEATVRLINTTDDEYVSDTLTNASGEYTFTDLSRVKKYSITVEYESGGKKYNASNLWGVESGRV